MSVLTPPERSDELHGLLRRVRRGETVDHYETERVRKDGRLIQMSLTLSPIRDAEGNVTGAASIGRDVTERIEADSERKALAEDLKRSNEELEQFAHVASHDLSEPLRVIAGFVQLLQQRYAGKLDEQADRFIDATVEGTERMQAMVDALLDYSRVGQEESAPELVDYERAASEAKLSLARLIEEGALSSRWASFRPSPVSPHSSLSSSRTSSRMPAKYGDAAHPSVGVSAEPRNGGWIFTVTDNGPGIDPDQREHVFEMFKRLHARDTAGTGIGLAICKRIVEKHGGRIWVEANDAGGSAFRFTVPNRRPVAGAP